MIKSEAQAQLEWEAQDPLAHGHIGNDSVPPVCGDLGHASCATGRAKAALLATESDEAIKPAVLATDSNKTMLKQTAA